MIFILQKKHQTTVQTAIKLIGMYKEIIDTGANAPVPFLESKRWLINDAGLVYRS